MTSLACGVPLCNDLGYAPDLACSAHPENETMHAPDTAMQLEQAVNQWSQQIACAHAPALRQVIVVEDENGNIVRETMKDTDTLARYKTMHETLVYLAHLDHDDTEQQMLDKLRVQVGIGCIIVG